MYGQNIGRLNVYVQTVIGSKDLVWRLAGPQNDSWLTAGVPIKTENAFKVDPINSIIWSFLSVVVVSASNCYSVGG